MLRYLNMFLIIGVALVLISIAGFATHDHFLMEPGQTPVGNLSVIYLLAGVIMIVNGVVSNKLLVPFAAQSEGKSHNSSDQSDTDPSAQRPATDAKIENV